MTSPLPPVLACVPHRPPSVLLDSLVEASAERLIARVRITRDSPFFEGDGVEGLVMIEYMAQAIAAFSGHLRRASGAPIQLGFLLACRQMTLAVDHLSDGDELLVEARHVWSSPPLAQFDCEVTRNGKTIAKATLSVYEGRLEDAGNA